MEQALKLFKLDLGINGNQKDDYFMVFLEATQKDLESRAIHLDLSSIDDTMLLVDYSAWKYRNRNEDTQMPTNIELRLLNRKVKRRAEHG